MKIFLAGGTGAVGRQLTPMLVEAGHEITAITRSDEHAAWIRKLGAKSVICDALDRPALIDAVVKSEPNAIINQLTEIPKDLDPKRVREQFYRTNRLRTEATQTLIEAAESIEVSRFVNQSVAFFYRPVREELATEEELLFVDAPKEYKDIIIAVNRMEHIVQDAVSVNPIVLRYGFFYGPGTTYAADTPFAAGVRTRRMPILGRGKGVFSFTHVRDAAAAVISALDSTASGCFNIVDDEPAEVREWLPYYATLLKAKRPWRIPAFIGRWLAGEYVTTMMTRQRGASNEKAKQELEWEPTVPDWREGFRQMLTDD